VFQSKYFLSSYEDSPIVIISEVFVESPDHPNQLPVEMTPL